MLPMNSQSLVRGSRIRKALAVLIIAVLVPPTVIVVLPKIVRKSGVFNPIVEIPSDFHGISTTYKPLRLQVTPKGAGTITSLSVRILVQGKALPLLEKSYGEGTRSVQEEIPLRLNQAQLPQGEALLEVVATDGSWLQGRSLVRKPIIIDTMPPVVKLVSDVSEERASRLIFYTASDQHLIKSGLSRRATRTHGYPAWSVDKALSTQSSLYVVADGAPLSDEALSTPTLFAEDIEGNISTLQIPRVTAAPEKNPIRIHLSDTFMKERVRELSQAALPLLQQESSITPEAYQRAFLPKNTFEELSQKYLLLATSLRELNMKQLATKNQSQRLGVSFSNAFILPQGEIIASFDTSIRYSYEGRDIYTTKSPGLYIKTEASNGSLYAANDGIVAHVGDLGVFGKCILIDHGLSIKTFYAHLSSTSVTEGSVVQRGQLIGFAGSSGLMSHPHIFFQMSIGETAVDPTPWSDPSQFYQNFTQAIEDIKKWVGIPSANKELWKSKDTQ
jgi:murein DD-endopeptidase MepM/ murein hydrolase activator NlpD